MTKRTIAVIGTDKAFRSWAFQNAYLRRRTYAVLENDDYVYLSITHPDQLRGREIYDYLLLNHDAREWNDVLDKAAELALTRVRQV